MEDNLQEEKRKTVIEELTKNHKGDHYGELAEALGEAIKERLNKNDLTFHDFMEGVKILNCPFCGKEGFVKEHVHPNQDGPDFKGYGIGCNTPNCHGCFDPDMAYYGTEEEAIRTWNTRGGLTHD